MTEERRFYEACTSTGQPIMTFDDQTSAERWEDCNVTFPNATVSLVTVTTTREPIKRRKLRLIRSGT
jgi:chloramphenicol 3-O-phosphotransferase